MNKKFDLINPGIWKPKSKFPSINSKDIKSLISNIDNSPKKRSRICVHPSETDLQQEMFISFDGNSYIQPSFHLIDESFHLLEGRGKYIFFDKKGKITHDIRLGDYNSDLPFYVRIPKNYIHSFIPLSSNISAHEVVGGSFSKSNTIFPSWSKKENEINISDFLDKVTYAPVTKLEKTEFKRISEEALQCVNQNVYLRKSDIDFIKKEMPKTKRKRLRILVHPNINHQMHEMFVVYSKNTFVRVNKHLGKDESLNIIEGEATFVFFDDNGKIINVVELSSYNSDKNFFIRVPRNVYHTIIMRSAEIVIHETTPGPFDRDDTIWAPWCPPDDQQKKCKVFQDNLEKQIKIFNK